MQRTLYNADDTNVSKIWELKARRTNHLKNLSVIYRERDEIREKSNKAVLQRDHNFTKYQKNREADIIRKNKYTQDKINYENSLLRNKLLAVMSPKEHSKSSSQSNIERNNIYRLHQEEEISRSNQRIRQKLS